MRFDYNTQHRDSLRLLRYPSERWAYAILALALVAAPWGLPDYLVGEMTFVAIMCVAGAGLMVLTGYTGQVSLGHSAFLAVGAYAHALLLGYGLPLPLSLALSSLICALLGVLIGIPAIRLHGLYLAMVTLALAMLVEHIAGRWSSLTGGFTGLAVSDPAMFNWSLAGLRPFYYLCLCVLAVVLLLLNNLLRGHTGRAFKGVRDSEAAASSLGLWVAGYKVLAFVISAAVCGLAGALMAHHVKYLTPEAFGMQLSLQLVLMVVIGGMGSLRGAVLGAILINLLPTFVSMLKSQLPDRLGKQSGVDIFVFGLVLALFVLFEPRGINGRWLRLKTFVEYFPLYRRDTFKRGKAYMQSERYR